jgi:HD-GYP domain-containing protein (c-di-GMP phosphodiesterase class II)
MKEVKTTIDALEVGMFVSRLDRPWIDTPFALEGLRINSKEDIEGLRKYTSFVFVNTEEGPTPDPEHWISVSAEELRILDENEVEIAFKESKEENEYQKLRKAFYEIEADFEEELEKAKGIKARIEKDFKKILADMSKGQELNVATLKDGIHAAVGSIIRNPSAFALLIQLEKSNEYAYSHALSCSIWCAHFGRHLGFEIKEIEELALGGMLLDLGKIKLPPELLNKREKITVPEASIIKRHVDYSVRILTKSTGISTNVMRMVATHHERANGKGYPQGIENKDIPIYGRIAGIVDSYDAMTTPRPYSKKTMSPNEAINELYKLRDSSFQSELIEQFIQTVGLYPTGSLVELNSGAVAIVLEVNDLKRLYPTVMMVLDKDKEPIESFETINLADNQTGLMVKKALPSGSFGINIEELFI